MLRLVQKQKNLTFRTRNALLGRFRLQFKEETIEFFKPASSNFGFVCSMVVEVTRLFNFFFTRKFYKRKKHKK